MNPHPQKTVDVIMPIFNGEKFITAALSSVESQTYPINHIYVIDDGSTDNGKAVIEKFRSSSKNLLTYMYTKNIGPSGARNIGIKKSTSAYVAFLDADDTWDPLKIQKQIELFEKGSEKLGIVYGAYDTIDESGSLLKSSLKYHTKWNGDMYEKLICFDESMGSLSPSLFLVKKEALKKVGLFDETLRWGEDWDMWLRITKEFELESTSFVLSHIRDHFNNTTKNMEYVIRNELVFFEKWVHEFKRKGVLTKWGERFAYRTYKKTALVDYSEMFEAERFLSIHTILFPLGKIWLSIYLHLPLWIIQSIKLRLKNGTKRS